jgi:cytochrome P450
MPFLGAGGNSFLFTYDPIVYMRKLFAAYGPVAAGVQGSPLWICVFGPTYNQEVLTHPDRFASFFLSLPASPDSALHHVTAGLLSLNGAVHSRHRRLILPAFHKHTVAGYHTTIVTLTQAMLERWFIGQRLDIVQAMRELTLGIVSRALFGLDLYRDGESLPQLLRHWLHLFTAPITNAFPMNLPFLPYRRLLAVSSYLEQALQAFISQRRLGGTSAQDVLAMLLTAQDEDGSVLSDAEIIGHLNLLFLAGHETSANALIWTLFLLGQHPQVYAALYDELNGTLHGEAPTVGQLNTLTLLDRVIKESLRLLPPAVYGVRVSTEECTLGLYTLPKRSTVIYSSFMTQRMLEFYPLPAQFRPSRWETIDLPSYAYIPFGGGPRRCIGATFAEMEIKLILAMIIQHCTLALAAPTRIDYQVRITLTPRHKIPMVIGLPGHPPALHQVAGTIRSLVDLP